MAGRQDYFMATSISTVVVERDSRARSDLAGIIDRFGDRVAVVAATADFDEGMRIIREKHPQIVILEVSEVERGVRELSLVQAGSPQAAVFVTSADKNPDWILRLIRAGASEYLTKPVVAEELLAAVDKVARQCVQRSGESTKKGRVITVYNPSGGMGTTTVAVNLAASLVNQGEKVALIDLNPFSCDVGTFLNLSPRYTLSSVIANMERVDARFLATVLAPHPSGIRVLCGPADIIDRDSIAPEQLRTVLSVMQSFFGCIVVDTGGCVTGINQAVFAHSDHLLYTTVLTLPALKNAKCYLSARSIQECGGGKIKLLVNRYHPKDDIKLADAEKVLSAKAFHTVPNAYEDVKTSINRGEPLVNCVPRSPIAKAVQELSRKLTQENASRGFLLR